MEEHQSAVLLLKLVGVRCAFRSTTRLRTRFLLINAPCELNNQAYGRKAVHINKGRSTQAIGSSKGSGRSSSNSSSGGSGGGGGLDSGSGSSKGGGGVAAGAAVAEARAARGSLVRASAAGSVGEGGERARSSRAGRGALAAGEAGPRSRHRVGGGNGDGDGGGQEGRGGRGRRRARRGARLRLVVLRGRLGRGIARRQHAGHLVGHVRLVWRRRHARVKTPQNIIRQSSDSNHLSQTSPNVIGDDQDLQHEAIEIHCYHQQASHIISADQKSPCFHKSASHQLLPLGKESLQLSPLTQNQEIQQPPPTHTLVELLEASEVYRIFTTDQHNLNCPAGKKVRRTHHLTVDKSHLQHFPGTEKCHNQVTSEFETKSTRNSFASSAKQYSFSDLQNLKENENLPANPIGIIKQSPSLSYVGNVRRSSSLNLDEKALGTQYLQLISTDTEADLGCNIAVKSSATDPGAQQSLAFSKLYNKKQIPNELLHSETPRANNKSIKSTLSAEKNISQPAENLLFTLHHVADKFPDKNVTMSGYDQPWTSEIHHSELLLQNDTSLNNQSFEEIKIKQHSKASTDMHSLLVNDEQFIHACLLSQTDQSEIDMQRGHISITSVQLEKSLDDTVQYIPQSSRIDKQECHTSLEPSPVNDSAFNVRPSKQHPTDITWVKKLSMPETLSIGIGPKDVNHNFHPPSDIGRMSTESETRNLRKSSSTNTKLPALTLSECTENSASQYMDSSTECPPHSALSTSTDSTCVNTLSEGHQSSMKSMLTAVVTTPPSPKDTDPRQDISARHKCCVSLLTSTKLRTFNSNDDADKPSNEVSDATEESRGKEAERANGSQFSLYYLFQCATETSNSICTVEDINLELTAEATAVKVENDKKDELNKRGDSASSSLIVTSEVHQPAGSGSSSGGHRRRRRRGRRRRVVRPSSAGGSGRGGGGGGGAGTAAEAAPRARCKRRPLLRRVRDVLRAHLASRRRRLASPPCLYLLRPSHARCPASTSVLYAQRHSLPSASAVDPADGV